MVVGCCPGGVFFPFQCWGGRQQIIGRCDGLRQQLNHTKSRLHNWPLKGTVPAGGAVEHSLRPTLRGLAAPAHHFHDSAPPSWLHHNVCLFSAISFESGAVLSVSEGGGLGGWGGGRVGNILPMTEGLVGQEAAGRLLCSLVDVAVKGDLRVELPWMLHWLLVHETMTETRFSWGFHQGIRLTAVTFDLGWPYRISKSKALLVCLLHNVKY